MAHDESDSARETPAADGRTKTAFALAAAAVGVAVLYGMHRVVLAGFVGILLAILFDRIARLGMRLRLPRPASVVAAAVLVLIALSGTVALVAVPVAQEGGSFLDELPKHTQKVVEWSDEMRERYPWAGAYLPSSEGAQPQQQGTEVGKATRTVLVTSGHVLEGTMTAIAIFFLGIFFAWDPERYKVGFARLWPGGSVRRRVETLEKIGVALQAYLLTVGVQIVVMAVLWSIGLKLCGIEYWLLFGVLGGLVEVIPYVGPMLGLIPPLFVGASHGVGTVGLLVGLYAVLHVIEGYVLAPWLMAKQVHLPPPVALLSIMGFGTLFGFLGVVLAVPIGTVIYVWVMETRLKEPREEAPRGELRVLSGADKGRRTGL